MVHQSHISIEQIFVEVDYLLCGIIERVVIVWHFTESRKEWNTHVEIISPKRPLPGKWPDESTVFHSALPRQHLFCSLVDVCIVTVLRIVVNQFDYTSSHRTAVIQFLHNKELSKRIVPFPFTFVSFFKGAIVIETESNVFLRKLSIGWLVKYFTKPAHGDIEHTVPVAPIRIRTFRPQLCVRRCLIKRDETLSTFLIYKLKGSIFEHSISDRTKFISSNRSILCVQWTSVNKGSNEDY